MVQKSELKRVFKLNSTELPDPDPKMSPEEVKRHYGPNFGAVLELAVVTGPTLEGERLVFHFEQPQAKIKG
jgi:PRTRC genetic system protein C